MAIFFAGLGLLGWCYFNWPTIHILWAAPLGIYMVVASLGKMAAR